MSNSKITELEEKLLLIQKELEQLKNEDEKANKRESDILEEFKDKLVKAQKEVINILKEIVEAGAKAASTTISISKFDGEGNGVGTSIFYTLDDIVEDGLAAALDVFTNPRRITILKLLIPESMTASEISQNTGLVGGQLYHHLSCLENAKLIMKINDKYRTSGAAQTLLCGLYTAVGGMDIARK